MNLPGSAHLLRKTVSSVLQVSESDISDESSPETLPGWDSVMHLNLVMAVEEAFGVEFTPEEMLEMKSVGMIRAMVERKQA
jgi:acyl carrier protein